VAARGVPLENELDVGVGTSGIAASRAGTGTIRDLIWAMLFVLLSPGDFGCLLMENRSLRFCKLDELRSVLGRSGNGSG
jgi:hypothetical protein